MKVFVGCKSRSSLYLDVPFMQLKKEILTVVMYLINSLNIIQLAVTFLCMSLNSKFIEILSGKLGKVREFKIVIRHSEISSNVMVT